MEFSLDRLGPRDRYKLLSGLVVPRPIAWVTTLNGDGSVNAAPFSYFNLMGTDPPVVAIGHEERDDGTPKDTPRNVRERGEFVVHVVDEALAEAMHQTSAGYAPGVSETERVGIETAPSAAVAVPRIAAAPAAIECREHATVLVGRTRVVLGVAVHLHVRDDLVDADRLHVDAAALRAVGRMGGPLYTRTRDTFSLGPRPKPDDGGGSR